MEILLLLLFVLLVIMLQQIRVGGSVISITSRSQRNIFARPMASIEWRFSIGMFITATGHSTSLIAIRTSCIAACIRSRGRCFRGPGKKSLIIKSKGLHASLSPGSLPDRASQVVSDRKNSVFGRFATPPIKVTFKAFFDRWLSEAGDIVPFSDGRIPDISAGTRGLSATRMEVVNRTPDWKRGVVS